MRSLTIISHTEHYMLADGSIVGLGSTVTEINHLLEVFDTITHVAMLHNTVAPSSASPYTSDKIKFVALPAVGGTTLSDKLAIVFQASKIIMRVHKGLKSSNYFQFRAPTGIGVFVIPYLILFNSKKGWFKYAGNWKQEDAPLAYRFQKWLLARQSLPVTINGFWKDQPKQCLSFENPCLTEEEIQAGQSIIASKTLQLPLEFCFVGRLEAAKGVGLIIDALSILDAESLDKIGVIHLVGEGGRKSDYEKQVEDRALPVVFHGYLSRDEVHQIYIRSHAILLPSASEGFPKVIAEAMNYGCIPIVSDVSSIGHYIGDSENGFLMKEVTVDSLKICILKLLDLEAHVHHQMATTSVEFINHFSYAYYNQRIWKEIL
ncbi:MAG: glycosyltransferase [Gelidibacter sp.]